VIRELTAALALHANIPGANYQLGFAHWKLGEAAKAEAAFLKELTFEPPDPHSLYYLGRIKSDAGQVDIAIHYFEKTFRLADILDVRRRLGSAYVRAGRIQDAVALLEPSVKLRPEEGELHYLLGRAYQQQGKLAAAGKEFDLARESKIKLQGDMRDLLDLRRALASHDSAQVKTLAARLRESNEPEVLISAGLAFGELNQHADALLFLKRAVEQQPNSPEAQFNLGRCYVMLGEADNAIAPLAKATGLKPDFYEAHVLLATLSGQAGNGEQAIKHLRSAVQVRPDNPKLLAVLGLHYMNGRYFEDAVNVLENAVQLDGGNADLHFLLIQAYYRNSDFERALATAMSTREKFPGMALSHYHAGAQLNNMGRLKEAKSELEHALRLDPDVPEAQAMLGDVLFKLGDAEKSIEQFRAVIAKDPNAMDAHAGIGRALIQLKRYQDAAGAMQHAIELDASVASLHLYLSQAYRGLGKPEEAKKEAAIFAELNRKRAEARDKDVERKYILRQ
jgi:tetratricopeptide (TPR) repeat protein